MAFLPWTTITRIVNRYSGDYKVRTLRCTEHYRVMAFAQLTFRENLCDNEACLSAQPAKLYHMGFREPIRRSTLADANENLDLTNTILALDSTTITLDGFYTKQDSPGHLNGVIEAYCCWRLN